MVRLPHAPLSDPPSAERPPPFGCAPAGADAGARVSVITPVHDDGPGLAVTARSLRAQSLQEWEWIIVNDASADAATLAALNAYRPGDARIRVIDEPARRGAAAARDAGVKAARTGCVVVLAPGDRIEPTALEMQVWAHVSLGRQGAGPEPMSARAAHDGASLRNGPDHVGHLSVCDELPFDNHLAKTGPRLLMLLPWLALGGADKFNLDLLEQLRRRGWDVTIATTLRGEQRWLPRFATATSDIFVLPEFLRLSDYPRFLRYLVGSRAADAVLISHSEFGYLLLPYLRVHFPQVAFLDFCHVEEEQWKGGGYPRLSVTYHALLDLSVVASTHLREWMVARGGDPGRIEVCHTNVDADAWRPDGGRRAAVRAALGLDDETPVILHAARLCAQKQPDVLAGTLRRLRERGIPFTALVAGEGPDELWLRRHIGTLGLGRCVRLLGPVTNERMRDLLAAADVFFLPSRNEGISLAIYEAMASAVCVVSADVGGQRELVTPECGVLLRPTSPSRDVERYADVLGELLRDPGRRRSLGQAAHARVASAFRLDDMGARMDDLIRRAIDRARARPLPGSGVELSQALAEQAVASMWTAEMAHSIDPYRTGWRTLAYFALRSVLRPWYERAAGRQWTWPTALKDVVKQRLLHH